MTRREFITLLGGAAAAWPVVARAQQGERMRRIGVLLPAAADDVEAQTRVGAFLQGLQQSGWSLGRDVRIDTRWATTNAGDIKRHALEMIALSPDVILAHGAATLAPLLQAAHTVPIVFVVVADPVGGGFVDSLAVWSRSVGESAKLIPHSGRDYGPGTSRLRHDHARRPNCDTAIEGSAQGTSGAVWAEPQDSCQVA